MDIESGIVANDREVGEICGLESSTEVEACHDVVADKGGSRGRELGTKD